MLRNIYSRLKCLFICKKKKINYNVYNFLVDGGKLGKNSFIEKDVFFGSEPYLITIGNNVRLTHGVKFVTHDGGIAVLRNKYEEMKAADLFGKIIIDDNVHIGFNTIIMPGVVIGANSIIGCGSIVTKSIPPDSVAAGCPAKVIKSLDQYFNEKKDKCLNTYNMNHSEKKNYLLRLEQFQ